MKEEYVSIQLEEVYDLFTSSYEVPFEYRSCIKQAINRYAQPHQYSEATLNDLVKKKMSPLDTFKYLHNNPPYHLNQWKGHFAEWLVCYEYNSIRMGTQVVFTMVNPDSRSKCDILHVIRKGNHYSCVAGPDIKTGSPCYVLNQLEKVWSHEGTIPFFDVYGILQDENKLTPRQQERLRSLKSKYPRRKILIPTHDMKDLNRLSNGFLRAIANQERGPTASAVRKAKANSRMMTTHTRNWTEFNYHTREKEMEAQRLKEEDHQWEQQKREYQEILERARKRNAVMNPAPSEKIISRAANIVSGNVKKMGKSLYQYIDENKVEIAVNILTGIYEAKRGYTARKTVEHMLQESQMRNSPVEHRVQGYYRHNGNYVNSYTRGRKDP